jgi:hypothetical protein
VFGIAAVAGVVGGVGVGVEAVDGVVFGDCAVALSLVRKKGLSLEFAK